MRMSKACWRNHNEATRLGKTDLGGGNSWCLVGSRRQCGRDAESTVRDVAGEGMEEWLVRRGL